MENLNRATQHAPAPWFYVQTSPNKAHVYWPLHGDQRYRNNKYYRTLQRKLRQLYDGDRAVIDATRVLRVPGFDHQKGTPHLVTVYSLPGYGQPVGTFALEVSLAHINAVDDGGGRHPLGDENLQAPSLEWALFALENMPVDGMEHPDFISFTAAYKQAVWNDLDEQTAKEHWLKWCERFGADSNGLHHNLKHWESIEDTETGWKSLLRMSRKTNGALWHSYKFQPNQPPAASGPPPGAVAQPHSAPVAPIPGAAQVQSPPGAGEGVPRPLTHQERKAFQNEILLATDQPHYFRGCAYIEDASKIAVSRKLLKSEQFQTIYGGKVFGLGTSSGSGQTTGNAWKAATQGRLYQIPKVQTAVLHPGCQSACKAAPLSARNIDPSGLAVIRA